MVDAPSGRGERREQINPPDTPVQAGRCAACIAFSHIAGSLLGRRTLVEGIEKARRTRDRPSPSNHVSAGDQSAHTTLWRKLVEATHASPSLIPLGALHAADEIVADLQRVAHVDELDVAHVGPSRSNHIIRIDLTEALHLRARHAIVRVIDLGSGQRRRL